MYVRFSKIEVNPAFKEEFKGEFAEAAKQGLLSDRMFRLFERAVGKPGTAHTLRQATANLDQARAELRFEASPEGQAKIRLEQAAKRMQRKDRDLECVEVDTPEWDEAYEEFRGAELEYLSARDAYHQIQQS